MPPKLLGIQTDKETLHLYFATITDAVAFVDSQATNHEWRKLWTFRHAVLFNKAAAVATIQQSSCFITLT